MRRLSTEQFISKANRLHQNKYDYKDVLFTQTRDVVEIICPLHGKFILLAASHIHTKKPQGCKICGREKSAGNRSLTNDEFLSKISYENKTKYDYSKTQYKNSYTKIVVICKEHGKFEQLPFNHLKGQNCPKCGIESRHGFTKIRYINHCKNKGSEASLYFIEVKNGTESFIKIGLTSTPLKKRFANLPYTYKVLDIFSGEPEFIWEIERQLHKELQQYKYSPSIYFKGHTECFGIEHIKEIEKRWKLKTN